MSWLKNYSNQLKQHPRLYTLRQYMQSPELWRMRCESVARGVAIGFACAMIAFLPSQMLVAAALAILLRANLPVAVLATWISNPVTVIPIIYLIYYVGDLILGQHTNVVILNPFNSQFNSFSEFFGQLYHQVGDLGKGYFVGLIPVTLVAALVGYSLSIIIWQGVHFIRQLVNKE